MSVLQIVQSLISRLLKIPRHLETVDFGTVGFGFGQRLRDVPFCRLGVVGGWAATLLVLVGDDDIRFACGPFVWD